MARARRYRTLLFSSPVLFVLILTYFVVGNTRALRLGERNLTLGSPLPLAVTTHTFTFTLPSDPSNDSIESIQFDYCETPGPGLYKGQEQADQACVPPAGIDVRNAAIQASSVTGNFTISSQDTNEIILSAGSGQNLSGQTVSFEFNNVTNPGSISNPSLPFPVFFVRISTYQNPEGTNTPNNNFVDYGAVSSGSGEVNVSTTVPPILDFCAAVTVGVNCEQANGSFLQFGTLNTFKTASAVSQFAIGTNASSGAVVEVYGNTLTSGNNTIAASDTQSPSIAGTSQFGLNLRANTLPLAGQNPKGNGTFTIAGNYDSPNLFQFHSGDVVASTSKPSDFQIFSATYIINISSKDPIGVYDTTISYICTATF